MSLEMSSDRPRIISVQDEARCKVVPILFSEEPERNGGFHPKPCPSEDLHAVKVFYYDWNSKRCQMSHMKVCPSDLADVFSQQLNSFSSLNECLESNFHKIAQGVVIKLFSLLPSDCAPKDFVCKLPFAPSEPFDKTMEHATKFSYNQASSLCEPYVSAKGSSLDKIWANQFDSLDECEGCQLVKAGFGSSCVHALYFVVCMGQDSASDSVAFDQNMPNPKIPQPWQCTDTPAIKGVPKNRSCLAYDNSFGYTFDGGQCVPSDYNGCIDTYNKFKDLETCSTSTILC